MAFQQFDENYSLAGKTALVTGAANGIGIEISKMYARKGANIVAFDIVDTTELGEYVREQGCEFLGIEADVTKKEQMQAGVDAAIKQFGKIDILVNNAGVGLVDKAEDLSEENWDTTMAINLKGPFLLSQMVGKTMIQNGGGRILFIASQAGIMAMDKHLSYGVSKAGIIYMTKLLGLEWAKYNIGVCAISPTVILTPLGERVWNNPDGEAFKKKIPAGRFGYPQEVAACAVFLASGAADLITGENLVIDGGFTIA